MSPTSSATSTLQGPQSGGIGSVFYAPAFLLSFVTGTTNTMSDGTAKMISVAAWGVLALLLLGGKR